MAFVVDRGAQGCLPFAADRGARRRPAAAARLSVNLLGPARLVRRAAFACAALLVAVGAMAGPAGGARLEQLPPSWHDDLGRSFALADLIGHRVILSMAYTRCHKVCPATLGQLQRIQQVLDARGEQASFVIVGLDPDSDDAASWHQYRANRRLDRSNWHFLTGTRRDVWQLARRLEFQFWTYDTHVVHDSRIVVFDTHGFFSSAFGPETGGDWLALL